MPYVLSGSWPNRRRDVASRWLARGEPHLPDGEEWLSDLERSWAARMRFPKRRQEFLVARWTLKQAVAQALGLPVDAASLARIEARHASDGAPELYVDGAAAAYDVTLTDRAGWAVCLLAPVGSAPGCDLELVEPRSAAFVQDYLTPAEQETFRAAADHGGGDLVANLLWSAKESALKVLRTGLRRDTRSVEVTLDAFADEGVWSPLVVRTAEGESFDGWWRRSGPFLLTTCARRSLPEPVPLEVPPSLDTAEPLHTWLAGNSEARERSRS